MEVGGKPVKECLHQGVHVHTNSQTTQNQNASSPIYWIGRGKKSSYLQMFSLADLVQPKVTQEKIAG